MTDPDLRFDAAINPYGCAPAVVTALHEAVAARGYRHYGDLDAGGLRTRLAAHFDLHPDNFLVYNGAGEAFVWQCLTSLLLPGGTFIAPFPSYERFVDVGRRCARTVVEVPLTAPDWRLPVDRFIEEARKHEAGMAMISSPNNPTGNRLLDESTLTNLLSALPKCKFIVDEAYAEYSGTTFAPLVRQWPNLIVLKTFSKAYGLAGLRVGYLVANAELAGAARRLQIPWAVDTLALRAAETALAEQSYLRQVVHQIRQDVIDMAAGLRRLPLAQVWPTDANFHLVQLPDEKSPIVAGALAQRGMVVRRRDDLPGYLRITSMRPEANRALLDTLADVLR